MSSPIGANEIRVVIRPVEARDYDLGPIPAELFKRTFDAFLTALQVTDRELQPKARSSEFLISQLALNPYEFGILEKRKALGQNTPSAIEFFRRCAEGIYRSDYQTVVRHPRVTRAFIRIVKALNPSFHVLAQFNDSELPVDDFFRRQVDRVGAKDDATRRSRTSRRLSSVLLPVPRKPERSWTLSPGEYSMARARQLDRIVLEDGRGMVELDVTRVVRLQRLVED